MRLMAFDVDGVLTDGSLYLTDEGLEAKAFSTLDGQGVKMLAEAGIEVAIITGRTSRVVALRAANLGITRVYQGAHDKLAVLDALLAELELPREAAGYMGDDLPDLPVLLRAGFAATVPESPEAIRSRVHYVTHSAAGRGAVREVCELILSAQGRLDAAIGRYLA